MFNLSTGDTASTLTPPAVDNASTATMVLQTNPDVVNDTFLPSVDPTKVQDLLHAGGKRAGQEEESNEGKKRSKSVSGSDGYASGSSIASPSSRGKDMERMMEMDLERREQETRASRCFFLSEDYTSTAHPIGGSAVHHLAIFHGLWQGYKEGKVSLESLEWTWGFISNHTAAFKALALDKPSHQTSFHVMKEALRSSRPKITVDSTLHISRKSGKRIETATLRNCEARFPAVDMTLDQTPALALLKSAHGPVRQPIVITCHGREIPGGLDGKDFVEVYGAYYLDCQTVMPLRTRVFSRQENRFGALQVLKMMILDFNRADVFVVGLKTDNTIRKLILDSTMKEFKTFKRPNGARFLAPDWAQNVYGITVPQLKKESLALVQQIGGKDVSGWLNLWIRDQLRPSEVDSNDTQSYLHAKRESTFTYPAYNSALKLPQQPLLMHIANLSQAIFKYSHLDPAARDLADKDLDVFNLVDLLEEKCTLLFPESTALLDSVQLLRTFLSLPATVIHGHSQWTLLDRAAALVESEQPLTSLFDAACSMLQKAHVCNRPPKLTICTRVGQRPHLDDSLVYDGTQFIRITRLGTDTLTGTVLPVVETRAVIDADRKIGMGVLGTYKRQDVEGEAVTVELKLSQISGKVCQGPNAFLNVVPVGQLQQF